MKRTIAIMLLLLALLTACGTAPAASTVDAPPLPEDNSPRILTPLTPGLHDPYVLLEDGYAAFGTYWPGYSMYCISGEGLDYGDDVSYREVVDLIGYDLLEQLGELPEHIRFTEDDMYPNSYRVSGETFDTGETVTQKRISQLYKGYEIGDMYGGYKIIKKGEPYIFDDERISRYRELTLCIGRADRYFDHPGEGEFHIVGWEGTDRQTLRIFPTVTARSRVGDVEVSFLFTTSTASIWPEYPDVSYYAGFVVDGIGYALQSVYGYCTQEEFITLTLAVIDAAAAHADTIAPLDPAEDTTPSLNPLVHDPFIESEDGYAVFNEAEPEMVMDHINAEGDYTALTGRLGFDPIDALASQPEHMTLTKEEHPGGGILHRDGEDQISYRKFFEREGSAKPTWLELRVTAEGMPKIPDAEMSYFNGTEVLLLHADPLAAMWPEQPLTRHSYYDSEARCFWDVAPHNCYFAAFERNGVTVVLYAHNGYCTQEEFLNAVIALIGAGR